MTTARSLIAVCWAIMCFLTFLGIGTALDSKELILQLEIFFATSAVLCLSLLRIFFYKSIFLKTMQLIFILAVVIFMFQDLIYSPAPKPILPKHAKVEKKRTYIA